MTQFFFLCASIAVLDVPDDAVLATPDTVAVDSPVTVVSVPSVAVVGVSSVTVVFVASVTVVSVAPVTVESVTVVSVASVTVVAVPSGKKILQNLQNSLQICKIHTKFYNLISQLIIICISLVILFQSKSNKKSEPVFLKL